MGHVFAAPAEGQQGRVSSGKPCPDAGWLRLPSARRGSRAFRGARSAAHKEPAEVIQARARGAGPAAEEGIGWGAARWQAVQGAATTGRASSPAAGEWRALSSAAGGGAVRTS